MLSPGVALLVFGLSEVGSHGGVRGSRSGVDRRRAGAHRGLRPPRAAHANARSSTSGCSASAASRRRARRSSSSARRCSARCCCCRSTTRSPAGSRRSRPGCSWLRRALARRSACASAAASRTAAAAGPWSSSGLIVLLAGTIPFTLRRRDDAVLAARGRRRRARRRPGLLDDAGDGRRLRDAGAHRRCRARRRCSTSSSASAARWARRSWRSCCSSSSRRALTGAGASASSGAALESARSAPPDVRARFADPVAAAFAHTYWWSFALTARGARARRGPRRHRAPPAPSAARRRRRPRRSPADLRRQIRPSGDDHSGLMAEPCVTFAAPARRHARGRRRGPRRARGPSERFALSLVDFGRCRSVARPRPPARGFDAAATALCCSLALAAMVPGFGGAATGSASDWPELAALARAAALTAGASCRGGPRCRSHAGMAGVDSRRGAKRAREARVELGLDPASPLRCLLTVVEERAGLPVVVSARAARRRRGRLLAARRRPRSCGSTARQPPVRQRFTLAHELAHAWCRHDGALEVDTWATLSGVTTTPYEVQANAFAAELLVPRAGDGGGDRARADARGGRLHRRLLRRERDRGRLPAQDARARLASARIAQLEEEIDGGLHHRRRPPPGPAARRGTASAHWVRCPTSRPRSTGRCWPRSCAARRWPDTRLAAAIGRLLGG